MISPARRIQFKKSRIRIKISGSAERPRLSVYRSLNYIYAQLIDDTIGKTLASASTIEKDLRKGKKSFGNVEAAKQVGKLIAERAQKHQIKKAVFDRNGRLFHGAVKAVADAAREHGLEF